MQEELGVPLNYTRGNDAMAEIFFGMTGDGVRFDISHLGYLLDRGLNIALLFGDRDYRCNCKSFPSSPKDPKRSKRTDTSLCVFHRVLC